MSDVVNDLKKIVESYEYFDVLEETNKEETGDLISFNQYKEMNQVFNEFSPNQQQRQAQDQDQEYDMGQMYKVTGSMAGNATAAQANYLAKGLRQIAQEAGIDLQNPNASDPNGMKRQQLLKQLPAIAYRVLFPQQMKGNRVMWGRADRNLEKMNPQNNQ